MNDYEHIKDDFLESRKGRIGASDIPALIPNPDKTNESLAGYGRTPITVWQEKAGNIKRDAPGLPAEMGHFLENKAIELFIREYDPTESNNIVSKKIQLELKNKYFTKRTNSKSCYKFHTRIKTDKYIVHPDCLFVPTDNQGRIYMHDEEPGFVNFNNPFIIEAKSASFFSANRGKSLVSGYDFNCKDWKGIPLKHYMQIQFQLLVFDVDVAYLALIHDTSRFDVWKIKKNVKHQERILKLVNNMYKCIRNDTPPKELIFNQSDIKEIYPNINNDFIYYSGDTKILIDDIISEYHNAKEQESKWKDKKIECLDSMAIFLKDNKEIRDTKGVIARWQEKKGRESLSVKDLKTNDNVLYKKLKDKGLIKMSGISRHVSIK